MSSSQLNSGEIVIMEGSINWVSLLPHIILVPITYGFWILVLIYCAIVRSKTKLTLTNKRLVGTIGGLLSSDAIDIPLNKISAVKVENSFLGKILGYATLQVASSSGTIDFDYIKGALQLRGAISEQVDKNEQERIQKQAAAMAQAMNRQ